MKIKVGKRYKYFKEKIISHIKTLEEMIIYIQSILIVYNQWRNNRYPKMSFEMIK